MRADLLRSVALDEAEIGNFVVHGSAQEPMHRLL